MKLTKVMAGGYLPVKKNTDKEKTSAALYKAMRAVERLPETDERHAFQHREQLFVFDASATRMMQRSTPRECAAVGSRTSCGR